jgi:large subunit ribosomal protein L14e
MFEVGRLCVKLAGRDAGKKCIVIDVLDDTYALIDGQTRRRKCNLQHLEPLTQVLEIAKNADHKAVVDALKIEGIECIEKKTTEKKVKSERPRKQKIVINKGPKPDKKAAKPKSEKKTTPVKEVADKKETKVKSETKETKVDTSKVKTEAKETKTTDSKESDSKSEK